MNRLYGCDIQVNRTILRSTSKIGADFHCRHGVEGRAIKKGAFNAPFEQRERMDYRIDWRFKMAVNTTPNSESEPL